MKKILLFVVALVFCVFAVFAEDYRYVSYKTTVELARNNKYHISEDFTINYQTAMHGIVRDIPYKYDNVIAKLSGFSCSDIFEKERHDEYYSIKIGSKDKIVVGEKHYNLQYDFDVGPDIGDDSCDLFYYNVLGVDNEAHIENYSFEVIIPKDDLKIDDFTVSVFWGSYGSKSFDDYVISDTETNYVISGELKNLNPYEGVTVWIKLPNGWFSDTRQYWDVRDTFNVVRIAASAVLLCFALFLGFTVANDGPLIISARFDAPDNLSPMFVGYLADSKVDNKDISSMIFYWADAGYISISEAKKNDYSFTKLKDLEDDVPLAEQKLFNGLFANCDSNGTISVQDLSKNGFGQVLANTRYGISGYFTGNRDLKDSKGFWWSLILNFLCVFPIILYGLSVCANEFVIKEVFFYYICAIFYCFINALVMKSCISKWHVKKSNIVPFIFSLIPSAVLFGILLHITLNIQKNFENEVITVSMMSILLTVCTSFILSFVGALCSTRLTSYGKRMKEGVLGFKDFIDKVKIDELKVMIDENPTYYYHILGYAIVLGLENKWQKKFASVVVSDPNWYSGVSTVDIVMMSALASGISSSVAKVAINKPSSIGGGSFSGGHGGGFSGGGLGGGGSHGW